MTKSRRVEFFKATGESGALTELQAEINRWFEENDDIVDDNSLSIVHVQGSALIVAIYWRERNN